MAILKRAYDNVIVWQAISKLNSPLASIRLEAMNTLRSCKEESLWPLKIACQNRNQPNSQIGAAIVLHWLGDEKGMQTLLAALKTDLPERLELQPLMEYAFLTINPQDAVSVLQKVWNEIPGWDTRTEVRSCICRVWVRIKNPVVLDDLAAQAIRFPLLFESSAAAFGASALPMLERMSRDPSSQLRSLSIRVLKQIPLARSFEALTPLLEDPIPSVRSDIPEALMMTGGAAATVCELSKAISKGYATASGMKLLLQINPTELLPIIFSLIETWKPSASVSDRSETALVYGLSALENSMTLPHQFVPPLVELVSQSNSTKVTVAISKVFRRHGLAEPAKSALTLQLSSPRQRVREEIAALLHKNGDRFGEEFILFLETCRPQESLVNRLHVVLRADPDSAQAASQLVKQVTNWFSKVSKEAAGRLNLAPAAMMKPDPILSNPRLLEHLRLLLKASLAQLEEDFTVEDAGESITSCVTALRGLGKLSPGFAKLARKEIVAALHSRKSLRSIAEENEKMEAIMNSSDVADMVRLSAAETIIQTYAKNSFPILVEALFSSQHPVRKSAIISLGQFGDPRAINYLQMTASTASSPFFEETQEAIAAIKKLNPEIMSLLRGSSSADAHPDLLLRPAAGASTSALNLLRPSDSNAP